MGIQVSWHGYDCDREKSNKQGEVRFTNPYSKRKLDEYLLNDSNTSLSQFEPPLKKARIGGSGSFRDRGGG
ncbi:hypothetical protein MTR_6g073000 [Medicago truncatula]|uniref:Uncharacterized protein n=1 Tax=Medicago truncatula TaxID=3880 RepID=G7KII7_MEDTR|nr:hypothetical protein MTR_6g073000 [Medicago truncatula]